MKLLSEELKAKDDHPRSERLERSNPNQQRNQSPIDVIDWRSDMYAFPQNNKIFVSII